MPPSEFMFFIIFFPPKDNEVFEVSICTDSSFLNTESRMLYQGENLSVQLLYQKVCYLFSASLQYHMVVAYVAFCFFFPGVSTEKEEKEESDYSDVVLPWGPRLSQQGIMSLLNKQDKAAFFSTLRKNKVSLLTPSSSGLNEFY